MSSITRFEVDEFKLPKCKRQYSGQRYCFSVAKVTNRPEIVEDAFQIAPDNIEVQKAAFNPILPKNGDLSTQ